MHKVILFALLMCATSSADFMHCAFINPGAKIGYQFGKTGGFIFGVETSVTYAVSQAFAFTGIVGGLELNVNQMEFIKYWEIEFGATLFGIAFGGEWNKGYHGSFRAFTGAMGFISYKHLFNTDVNEVALIGKYPYYLYTVQDHGTYLNGKRIGD